MKKGWNWRWTTTETFSRSIFRIMVQSDGHLVSFNDARQYPYKMTETAYLYRNGYLVRWNKKNCIKCFPFKKAEIEAWFAEHKKADATDIRMVLDQCKAWGE